MKRQASLLGLAARRSLRWVLLLLAVLAVLETLLFWLAARDFDAGQGYQELVRLSGVPLLCGLGFLGLCVLLGLSGSGQPGARPRYLLARLPVGPRAVFLSEAGYCAGCFLLFWAAQAVLLLGLGRWFVYAHPADTGPQSLFLAFYLSPFLHSLLPLAEASRYIRNILLVLGLGAAAARFSGALRDGKLSLCLPLLAAVTAAFFGLAGGGLGNDFILSALALVALVLSLKKGREDGEDEA